jgi:hypothetical protein
MHLVGEAGEMSEILGVTRDRDAYAATTEMITRYVELSFDISIISLLFVGGRVATLSEGEREDDSAQ